jgi:ABC-2 type transport system permease protein
MSSTHLQSMTQPLGYSPARRTLRAYAIEAKYESIRLLREPSFAITFLVLPLVSYLVFGVAMGGRGNLERSAIVFVNWIVIAVAGPGLFGFGMVLAMEREQNLLTLKRALPAPPGSFLFAKMVMAMLFATIIMVALSVSAILSGVVRLTVSQFFSLALVSILGSIPFSAIGLWVGTIASARSAPAFVNIIYLPSILLARVFFFLPPSIHALTYISPVFYLIQLARTVLGASHICSPWICVVTLSGLSITLVGLSVRRLAIYG